MDNALTATEKMLLTDDDKLRNLLELLLYDSPVDELLQITAHDVRAALRSVADTPEIDRPAVLSRYMSLNSLLVGANSGEELSAVKRNKVHVPMGGPSFTHPLAACGPVKGDDIEAVATRADIFFSSSGAGVDRAKQICLGCLAIVECAEFAINQNIDKGTWGGLSERERRSLARRQKQYGREAMLHKAKSLWQQAGHRFNTPVAILNTRNKV